MASKTWRKEAIKLKDGVSWRLVRGRLDDRIRLGLGRVHEAVAQKALVRIQGEEDGGTVARILAWYERDTDAAIRFLIGDEVEDALAPEVLIDYGAMPLEEYQRTVYGPWRQQDTKAWRSEAGYWRRIHRELGAVKLRDIDAHLVADYLDGLTSERGPRKGEPAAGNTKRLHRAALQALLIRAERLKHIERAPDLARFRLKDSTRTVVERSDPLTLDELVKLMDASSPKHRAMWAVGAGEGLRPSELMRIRWEDIDWSSRVLRVRGDADGEGKTALSVDTIPLTPLAFQELQVWWMRQGQPAEGPTFPSRRGQPYLAESGYKKALAKAAEKAGIERDVTPYLLRHSFATIAWSLGIEMDVARRMMRHVDEKMLREVYCRPRPADLVERVAAFARPPK